MSQRLEDFSLHLVNQRQKRVALFNRYSQRAHLHEQPDSFLKSFRLPVVNQNAQRKAPGAADPMLIGEQKRRENNELGQVIAHCGNLFLTGDGLQILRSLKPQFARNPFDACRLLARSFAVKPDRLQLRRQLLIPVSFRFEVSLRAVIFPLVIQVILKSRQFYSAFQLAIERAPVKFRLKFENQPD
ncbi:MAG: hypothetical protein HONDAALG_02423 [Gammaproteobacteria bacterium]|nr:hypothetical protein [Gammaproteobacteria bacterium]